MAHTQSTIKRIRQSRRQNQHNRHYRSMMRTSIKKVLSSTEKADAEAKMREAVSLLDKMASKGLIHKNRASNQKSRLTLHVNKLA